MTAKTFPLHDVITCYNGITFYEDPIPGIAQVANHVSGQNMTLVQLATERPVYAKILGEQLPFLKELDVPAPEDKGFTVKKLLAWLEVQRAVHGAFVEVSTEPNYRELHFLDGIPEDALAKTQVFPPNEQPT